MNDLCTVCLEPELFEAADMQVGSKDLMAMRVVDLKIQEGARGTQRACVGQQGVAPPAAACGDCA